MHHTRAFTVYRETGGSEFQGSVTKLSPLNIEHITLQQPMTECNTSQENTVLNSKVSRQYLLAVTNL